VSVVCPAIEAPTAKAKLCSREVGKVFSHTVDDGTDDLMDLAIAGRISAGKPSCQSRSEALLDGLEGTLDRRWSAEGRSERPLQAAVSIVLELVASSIAFNGAAAYLLSIVRDGEGECGGSGEVVMRMEELQNSGWEGEEGSAPPTRRPIGISSTNSRICPATDRPEQLRDSSSS
jgi:hypothetical protein